jgi:hypothetical protein
MAGKIFDSGKVGLGTGVTCTSFTELKDSANILQWTGNVSTTKAIRAKMS